MRSTKASAAVTRLNTRDPAFRYSMGLTANGYFYLLKASPGQAPVRVSEDMEMDQFVTFVNAQGPQKVAKVSKLDVAFERQLRNKS